MAQSGEIAPGRILSDVAYLETPQRSLRLDLYLDPETGERPIPVILFFHGGGWARGAPPQDWTGFRPYLGAGYSVATVEYRLAGEALAPAAVQDARCAIHWVARHAVELGVDSEAIVVMGTSAGGHLALMAALLPPQNDIDPPQCRGAPRAAAVLDFYGPADLTWQAANGRRHPTIAAWTGPGPEGEALAAAMSPLARVEPNSPPMFIVHGDADPVVPVAQSRALALALEEAGVPHRLHIVPDGGHGGFGPDRQREATELALDFLSDTLGSQNRVGSD